MADIVAALSAVLPADVLVTDPDVVASYAHDEAEWAPFGAPAALVRATSTEQVQAVVAACQKKGFPMYMKGMNSPKETLYLQIQGYSLAE